MKKYIWIITVVSITWGLLGCDDGENKNNEISEEHYNKNKKLLPSKITTIQYDYQNTSKESAIITSTFKYNNKNLTIEETTKIREKDKITLMVNIKLHYDNKNRYIGHSGIQENFISNQPTKTLHTSAKIKYKNNKIAEEYYYTEGILSYKWIVTEWDGNKPIKRENIGYSKDGKEIYTSTQINTYEGENIIHKELHKSDGTVSITDRVFDDKKTPEWNDIAQKGYYVYCWSGKNNIVTNTIVSSKSTLSVKNKLKYNSEDMLIEEDSYHSSTGYSHDYLLREKSLIEYIEK